MREAGEHTTWTDPDEEFETAVHAAVDAASTTPMSASVLDELVSSSLLLGGATRWR